MSVNTMAEKNISFKGGSIKFSAQFNKKLSNIFVYLKFDTTEDGLLYKLLQKYIHEKVLIYGCNTINEIYNALATSKGIMFCSSEKKIWPNIVNIIAYLNKAKLNNKEAENIDANVANFTKLHKDVMNFSVYATGKTIHIIRALSNADDKKIPALKKALEAIVPAKIDNIDITKGTIHTFDFDGDNRAKLDLAVALEDTPFVFDGKDIKLLSSCPCQMNIKYEYLRNKLKSYLVSCGSPGSPAANDEGATKYKAKCKYILECLNYMTFMVSDIHGFKYEFKNIDEIKNGVISENVQKIKKLMKSVKV